ARAVRVGVVDVDQVLVVGIGVDGGHQATFDTQFTVQDLRHRSQAVSGAGCAGNDLMRLTQGVVVDAIHDSGVRAFGGSRDNDLARTGSQMRGGLGAVSEQTGAFEHHVDVLRFPRQLGRV